MPLYDLVSDTETKTHPAGYSSAMGLESKKGKLQLLSDLLRNAWTIVVYTDSRKNHNENMPAFITGKLREP